MSATLNYSLLLTFQENIWEQESGIKNIFTILPLTVMKIKISYNFLSKENPNDKIEDLLIDYFSSRFGNLLVKITVSTHSRSNFREAILLQHSITIFDQLIQSYYDQVEKLKIPGVRVTNINERIL
ncbi:hypothetical protein RCL_jg8158.t1 [Rhizophagus clarus]|uniref:Uncharacterized protein n=1 Tax=Rhizophagus clarus TaxID=94130 RepID=A0A8H3R624_9GLOM|nr:hypothetical protein RCL_jg8158.t1 [Rhizophagus clarus]